jgi:hypothetical protein
LTGNDGNQKRRRRDTEPKTITPHKDVGKKWDLSNKWDWSIQEPIYWETWVCKDDSSKSNSVNQETIGNLKSQTCGWGSGSCRNPPPTGAPTFGGQ